MIVKRKGNDGMDSEGLIQDRDERKPAAERRDSVPVKISVLRFNPLDDDTRLPGDVYIATPTWNHLINTPLDPDAEWTSRFLRTPDSARINPSESRPEPAFQTTSGEILPYSLPTVPDPARLVPRNHDFIEPSLPEPHSPFSAHFLPSLPPSRTPSPEPIESGWKRGMIVKRKGNDGMDSEGLIQDRDERK
ncbi:hypothetical protein BOTBODRAFT_170678 [Botryobasidium botryosum FD-172 SS1]|uniref:Uncharacterized protein n=1 Tax=Botryobasidium botryosum (strain FD-172 SS1) TaxID=930990 RepID=A0A067N745_BOTB1|nr:hypothetical protein BOTBODRAFT_170678 [Botryobasidium botryosum FD-172 SS1]